MSGFQELVDTYLDSTITPEQARSLNAALLGSDECLRRFATQVQFHYLMRENYTNDASWVAVLTQPVPFEEDRLPSPGEPLASPSPRPKPGRRTAALIAVPLLLLLGLMALVLPGGRTADPSRTASSPLVVDPAPDSAVPSKPDPIAVATSVTAEGREPLRVGQPFYVNDRITFETGTLSLRFTLGVNVDLTGPVDLEFAAAGRAILHRGQLTADVEPSAIGFTIATPHADIIDQGTKFGVHVQESGNADVVVFEGRVDIDYRHRDLEEAQTRYERLKTGEAVHIEGYGQYHRISVVRSTTASKEWSTKIGETESKFISSVSDNFPASSRPIYYGLVPMGFDEDALCYVDRAHQWNSLPGIPFPEPLRGGDYLRLMNDLKFVMNLEIKISLRRPADVYVLLDQRVPPPTWLVRDFMKTPMTIGADEYDPQGILGTIPTPNSQTLGVGPGESIDQAFDIWVRHCEASGDVILGSLVEFLPPTEASDDPKVPIENLGLSVYGVVVTVPSRSPGVPAVQSPTN